MGLLRWHRRFTTDELVHSVRVQSIGGLETPVIKTEKGRFEPRRAPELARGKEPGIFLERTHPSHARLIQH